MKNLLSFNPFFRMTAFECLNLNVFDPVRDAKKESVLKKLRDAKAGGDSSLLIELEVDRDEAFDYENSSNAKYSVDDLKKILASEIKEIRNELR